jgi:hypothetical protein
MRGFVIFTTTIGFFAKILLTLTFWILKIKIGKGENEPLNQV